MNKLLASFSLALLFFTSNFSCFKTDSVESNKYKPGHGFAINFYNFSETSKYNTDTYKYDSTWINFLNNIPLSDIKITDENIESYDWAKQQITLTPEGKNIFTGYLKKKENGKPEYRSWEKPFIVTLNGKRLYAGRIELRYSQMAIQYPIISYGENGDNHPNNFDEKPVLWLIPYLVTPPKGDPKEGGNLTVRNEEIRSYFEKIGKIK